ncbi:3-keto-5-aminohexanoate cleavage protein [Salinarimonas soli]|uniref:3-keto-5-aminohexanoate cleavage protein n=1 Tax=Salinarimonas soli TaxID=1638099 RepID=A0A5B2VDC2_9HYPH|nr:3-keto-5-aminohexanoate cleavage protein [Salinarimonas soli]KAA2236696.1 3-keto-5-aminohexanoate cleavage protein [Salinarimonas soli]
MTRDVWIEVALNGPWGRERQPLAPLGVAEIVAEGIACARAGAAIVHAHAFDEATGRQRDDWETYARIIEGIRSKVDAIVYPTIPIAGSGYAGELRGAAERYAHLSELARRGLVEWAVVDPGSVNFTRLDAARGEPGFVYLNPEDHVAEGLRICEAHGVRPSYAVYELGFTRLGALMAARHPRLPTPVYRFMFSDEFAWGAPPRPAFLDAHLALLAEAAKGAPWMVAGLGVDVTPLIEPATARGGHVRVGLEDAPWGTTRANVAWVEHAAREVSRAGGRPAEARRIRETAGALDAR